MNNLSVPSIIFLYVENVLGNTITSTVPTKSSIVRYAISCPVFVGFTDFAIIIPPIVAFESTLTFGSPVSSSSSKSVDIAEICFFHIAAYSSSGCPLTQTPSTSFSNARISSFVYSLTSGIFISNCDFSLSSTRSKSDICPEIASFPCFASLSSMRAYTLIIWRLLFPNVSNAPDFIRFSSVRLFKSVYNLLIKSCILVKRLLFLSSIIAFIVGLPSDFTAERPNLIALSSTENSISEVFTSGGSICIFI